MNEPLGHLARPPRAVPLSLRLGLRLSGVAGVVGWMFVGVSMIAVTINIGLGDFRAALALERATLVQAEGVALGWQTTSAHVNDQPVLANGAVFGVDGREYECRSYALGAGLARGEPVGVEYDPADPSVCRIKGMDASIMPWWTFLIAGPFLLLGLAFAAWRWRRGGALIRLLRDGKLAWGERVSKVPTKVHVNDRRQWKYTVRFEDELGRPHEASGRTTDTRAMEAGPRAAVLYAPHQPSLAVLAATEARLLQIDDRGAWRAPGARVVGVLIAPAISVALGVLSALLF